MVLEVLELGTLFLEPRQDTSRFILRREDILPLLLGMI